MFIESPRLDGPAPSCSGGGGGEKSIVSRIYRVVSYSVVYCIIEAEYKADGINK